MARHSLKPCPRYLLAHWQTGGQIRIRYIPEFMELCQDCCDPGEIELKRKGEGTVQRVRPERAVRTNQEKNLL
jgi:hypothetical protein